MRSNHTYMLDNDVIFFSVNGEKEKIKKALKLFRLAVKKNSVITLM